MMYIVSARLQYTRCESTWCSVETYWTFFTIPQDEDRQHHTVQCQEETLAPHQAKAVNLESPDQAEAVNLEFWIKLKLYIWSQGFNFKSGVQDQVEAANRKSFAKLRLIIPESLFFWGPSLLCPVVSISTRPEMTEQFQTGKCPLSRPSASSGFCPRKWSRTVQSLNGSGLDALPSNLFWFWIIFIRN